MRCSRCGRNVMEGAAWCDCGFVFDAPRAELLRAQGHLPRVEQLKAEGKPPDHSFSRAPRWLGAATVIAVGWNVIALKATFHATEFSRDSPGFLCFMFTPPVATLGAVIAALRYLYVGRLSTMLLVVWTLCATVCALGWPLTALGGLLSYANFAGWE